MSCLCHVIFSPLVLAYRGLATGKLALETIWLAQERIKIHRGRLNKKRPSYRCTKHIGFEYSSCFGKTSKPSSPKHVLARFAWSKFLSQVLVFHNDTERKDQSELVSSGWELSKTSPLVEFLNVMEYYQARKTVLDHISKHQGESWKYYAWRSIFDELRASS